MDMDLYTAIDRMRELTRKGDSFSFSFMSYSESSASSKGIVDVSRARLRKRPSIHENKNAEIMEAYVDLDTGEAKQFYQPLLMSFNGQKIVLQ